MTIVKHGSVDMEKVRYGAVMFFRILEEASNIRNRIQDNPQHHASGYDDTNDSENLLRIFENHHWDLAKLFETATNPNLHPDGEPITEEQMRAWGEVDHVEKPIPENWKQVVNEAILKL